MVRHAPDAEARGLLAELAIEAAGIGSFDYDALIERLRPGRLQDDIALVAIRLHPQDRPRPAEAGRAHVPRGVPPE